MKSFSEGRRAVASVHFELTYSMEGSMSIKLTRWISHPFRLSLAQILTSLRLKCLTKFNGRREKVQITYFSSRQTRPRKDDIFGFLPCFLCYKKMPGQHTVHISSYSTRRTIIIFPHYFEKNSVRPSVDGWRILAFIGCVRCSEFSFFPLFYSYVTHYAQHHSYTSHVITDMMEMKNNMMSEPLTLFLYVQCQHTVHLTSYLTKRKSLFSHCFLPLSKKKNVRPSTDSWHFLALVEYAYWANFA